MYQKFKFLGIILDLKKQKFQQWGMVICVVISFVGDFDVV